MALPYRPIPRGCCFGPQRSAIYRRRGMSEGKALVELPPFNLNLSMRILQQHVPDFYNALRETGNRRIDPMDFIRHHFTNYADQPIFAEAVKWLFLTILEYQQHNCHMHAASIPFQQDPFKSRISDVHDAIYVRDLAAAQYHLDEALRIFEALSTLIQQRRFGFSRQIFDLYFDIALQLAPLLAIFNDGEPLFNLVHSVAGASGNDFALVQRLVQQFTTAERAQFEQYCETMARTGDIFGGAMWRLLSSGAI